MERLLLAIWNGPFYVGPLTRPISLGDAIMKVLETAWRAVVILVCALALLLGFLFIMDKRDAQRRADRLRDVSVVVSYAADQCGESFPVRAVVTNRSSETMGTISYGIELIDPATKANVAPRHFERLQTPGNLPAGHSFSRCLTPYFDDSWNATGISQMSPGTEIRARAEYVIDPL